MALIENFRNLEQETSQLHKPVEARIATFKRDGLAYIQINTYGRPDREIPGKVSQTIQLNEVSAKQLIEEIDRCFDLGLK